MPSFDIVSEYDSHDASNAVDQANREIDTRFDFRGSNATFTLEKENILLESDNEFQLQQMLDILHNKLVKRGIDITFLDAGDPEQRGKRARQTLTLKEGIDQLTSKKIVKLVKEKKMKVQAAIQGEKVRITGKKRDDLQSVMAMLKEEKLDVPLQFNNFRD
ncbi:MAG: YajQ family cyclic di-GMP-binding protein [Gammaproteobacteria bacterium]|nr:YajQ family cyclic di-GMP-binding protein [Gammaproteobacteria bacterium]